MNNKPIILSILTFFLVVLAVYFGWRYLRIMQGYELAKQDLKNGVYREFVHGKSSYDGKIRQMEAGVIIRNFSEDGRLIIEKNDLDSYVIYGYESYLHNQHHIPENKENLRLSDREFMDLRSKLVLKTISREFFAVNEHITIDASDNRNVHINVTGANSPGEVLQLPGDKSDHRIGYSLLSDRELMFIVVDNQYLVMTLNGQTLLYYAED